MKIWKKEDYADCDDGDDEASVYYRDVQCLFQVF